MAGSKILQRLAIDAEVWLENMPRIEKDFHHLIACVALIATILAALLFASSYRLINNIKPVYARAGHTKAIKFYRRS